MNENKEMKWRDSFEIFTSEEATLVKEVDEMEENSTWYRGIESCKGLKVIPIPSPIEVPIVMNDYGLDYERTIENATEGTSLLLKVIDENYNEQVSNISKIALPTLYETAKLNGSALSRMYQVHLSECLNYALNVAKGSSLILVRRGKIMALHSDAAGGYAVMPISELIKITKNGLAARFGEVKFKEGYMSNAYMQAIWELPDAKDQMMASYQSVLANSVSHFHAIDFMPSVRLSSSDTARSSAILQPCFRMNDRTYIRLGNGISVKHERKSQGIYGTQLYEDEIKNVFAKFNETFEKVKEMAETEIWNPVNCFIGIINHINRSGSIISKTYADAAREEVEIFASQSPCISMHDIYLSMSQIVSSAKAANASRNTIFHIEEGIARVLTMNWKDFDIGGVVSWGNK